jgi:hypothetical protein
MTQKQKVRLCGIHGRGSQAQRVMNFWELFVLLAYGKNADTRENLGCLFLTLGFLHLVLHQPPLSSMSENVMGYDPLKGWKSTSKRYQRLPGTTRCQWIMAVILGTQEAEIRRIAV